MRKFYKIARNMESKPSRLIATIGLAFVVMLFVNGFIGGMGGLPTCIAFLLMFFWLRTWIGAGNQITHQLTMSSRREISYLLLTYSIGYLLLWGILRMGYTISRVTGWGNINGSSASTYLQNLLTSSMLEKWAYLIAAVWMFAFVVSLFPLVVIRERTHWMIYALADGAVFALLCDGMGQICERFFEGEGAKPATCLIDHLLLCEMTGVGELVVIAVVGGMAIAVFAFTWWYAVVCYGPRRGKTDDGTIEEVKRRISGEAISRKQKHWNIAITGGCALAVIVVVLIILFTPEDTTRGYHKVAKFMTDDRTLGPIAYQGELYVPVNESANLDETGIARGYLADSDEDCSTRFYQLAVANLLYVDPTKENNRIQMKGASSGVYAPIREVEAQKAWETDNVFLLWDEDWVSESVYTHEPTGYTACNKDFIEGLEMQFPDAFCKASDFSDYDAYFTICAYPDMETALEDDMTPGDWVGCILVKNNKFYYNSYDNRITGISLQQLLDILGGY